MLLEAVEAKVDSRGFRARVGDFGLARAAKGALTTATFGTCSHMSPGAPAARGRAAGRFGPPAGWLPACWARSCPAAPAAASLDRLPLPHRPALSLVQS